MQMEKEFPELTLDQAIAILREVAKLDSTLFDLAVSNFNNTGLLDVVRSQTDKLKELAEALAELKGEKEEPDADESAELEADDNEGD